MKARELARLLETEVFDLEGAAAYLGVERNSVEVAALRGRIPYVHWSRKKLFCRDDLDYYARNRDTGRRSLLQNVEPFRVETRESIRAATPTPAPRPTGDGLRPKVTVLSARPSMEGKVVKGQTGYAVVPADDPEMVYVHGPDWYGGWPIAETSLASTGTRSRTVPPIENRAKP